jgi:hypothetical protein
MDEKNISSSDCGWSGRFSDLIGASLPEVVNKLTAFVRDSTPEQIRAWNASIPLLQVEVGKVIKVQRLAEDYGAILEYKMPFFLLLHFIFGSLIFIFFSLNDPLHLFYKMHYVSRILLDYSFLTFLFIRI